MQLGCLEAGAAHRQLPLHYGHSSKKHWLAGLGYVQVPPNTATRPHVFHSCANQPAMGDLR